MRNKISKPKLVRRQLLFATFFLLLTPISLFTFFNCTSERERSSDKKIYTVKEEIRIGSLEGEDEYIFGDIIGIAPGIDGMIFIADPEVPIVRMFDENGRFIKNVGGEGEGPGEYRRISDIKSFRDGRLAVLTTSLMRINVYDPQGESLESVTVLNDLYSSNMLEVGFDGHFFVKTVIKSGPEIPNWEFGWLKVAPDGVVADTIKVPADREERPLSFVLFTASGPAYPFRFVPYFDMNSDGSLIHGHNSEYKIDIISDRKQNSVISRPDTAVELLAEEYDQWEAWKDYYNTVNVIRNVKPYFKRIITDSDGRIWIHKYVKAEKRTENIGPHYGPESLWWEQPTFDVFEPDGRFWATVKLPWRANFVTAKDDLVYAIYKGEYDEKYAVRYRISR